MKTKKIRLTLVGQDDNAFALMGAFRRQAKNEGWTEKEINSVLDEAMSSDYNHLLATLDAYCIPIDEAEDDDPFETETD